MPVSGCFAARLASILGIASAMLMPHTAEATKPAGTDAQPQAVVLILGGNLLERRLPAFMQIQPGRFLAAGTVQRACASSRPSPESVLLYLPDSNHCELIKSRDSLELPHRLHKLTGRWSMHDPQVLIRQQPFVAIEPIRDRNDQAVASCTCPGNTPPVGNVICDAQTRTEGTPIGPVTFLANDADGDTLTGTFTYQRDADPVQAGLPSPLSSSCTPGAGTLQCTVQGLAPGPAGILTLNLAVSDGTANLPLDSLLEVLAPVPDRIFADGYEPLSCP